ncbi:MAG: 4Fe-4S binding protein [Candidatus Flexifilum sp.]|jgi:polyferredoxin
MTGLERSAGALDVLRLPLLGRLLRWRYGRLVFQIPFLIAAALLVYDGFTGSPIAAQNLATIVPWVHYRGVVVIALLLVGNLFCMGCPFTLPRTLAKRLSLRGRRWPRALRSKWLAIASLFALFFLYEYLDLWASPALTAWLIVAYFVTAFALEALFSESPFCKYVCPLGTFNFVYSTVSPLQITVRDGGVCKTCVGKECVNGSYSPQPVIVIDSIGINGQPERSHVNGPQGTPGCGTLLFPPQMQSNLDCIACLDCARACPHDNVAWQTRPLGAELTRPDAWPRRYDVAFLVVGLAFMGLVNAFGMVPPVYDLMAGIADALGLTALGWTDAAIEAVALGLIFIIGALIAPMLLTLLAAALARRLTGTVKRDSLRVALTSFAPAFVPIGLGLWGAHYGFHFLIGFLAIIPAFQQFLLDHGIAILGQPDWSLAGISDLTVVGLIQTIALLAGFAGSLWVAQRIALRLYRRQATLGLLPWALLLLAMMLAGLWLFSQPMEMRGTILFD